MEIKCPYCGSEECEVYDIYNESEERIKKLCICLDCNNPFSIIYAIDCIEKES